MEIEINGIRAELGDSIPAITKKSIDINNPSSRHIDFSNKIQLPDTQINRRIFESPEGIGTNNRSFDQLYDVVIRDVTQIFRGKGYLDSSRDTFSFQIIDNSKELFKALEIQLRDISWDDKDTILTTTAIDALDTADIDNCWYWGKACYHENAIQANTDQISGGGNNRCKYSRPSFYVQGLLNRAVENAGYIFSSPLPDLAISACHNEFLFTSYQKTLDSTYSPSGTLALSGLDTNDFEHSDLTVTSTTIAIGTLKTKFRIRGHIQTNALISITIRGTDDLDSSKVVESKLILPSDDFVDFGSNEFQSDDGMTIDIFFSGTGSAIFTDVLLYTILQDETEDLSTNPWLGYKIKAYDNLPELTYLDLFRTICVISNKYQVVDNYNKVFDFDTMADLSKLNSVDWSQKFIIGSQLIDATYENLGQKNYLKYTNDVTVNADLGEGYFDVNNESLQAEIDYIVMNFGASNDITIDSNDIAHLRVYNDTTRIPDQELSIRLFQINSDKLQFSPIKWTNIVQNYYANWFNCFVRIRTLAAEFNLSKLDFMQWQPKQLVYIDFFKSTFIVLEIGNFIPGRKTKVKLLNYGR